MVAADDGPRPGVTLERRGRLKPVFRPDGTVTAGNCCPLNDGAAALVVMSDTQGGASWGSTPLARIVSTGVSGLSPEIMGLGPVEASRRALARAGMTIGDIDLVEINEAFAAQVIPSAHELGIDLDRLTLCPNHPLWRELQELIREHRGNYTSLVIEILDRPSLTLFESLPTASPTNPPTPACATGPP